MYHSYPFTVDERKTRYGPSRDLTTGNGIAAASSITSSSTWESFSCSCGCIYCKEMQETTYIRYLIT
jgi:hypothetical protein